MTDERRAYLRRCVKAAIDGAIIGDGLAILVYTISLVVAFKP